MCQVLRAPRPPWQNAYAEGLIGSIRRDFLDHLVVFDESSLRLVQKSYFKNYEKSRPIWGWTKMPLSRERPIPENLAK